MRELAFRDLRLLFVLLDEGLESKLGTQLEIWKFVPKSVDPCKNVVVFLLIEVNDPL